MMITKNRLGTASAQPYFMRLEVLRDKIEDILEENGGLTIQKLFEKTVSFRVPTTRYMSAILLKDPKKRFRCENKIWYTG